MQTESLKAMSRPTIGNTVLAPVVWGVNKFGQEVKQHDKLSCGNGHDTWFTHVMFDTERNCWHRENDYYKSKVVGSYNGCLTKT